MTSSLLGQIGSSEGVVFGGTTADGGVKREELTLCGVVSDLFLTPSLKAVNLKGNQETFNAAMAFNILSRMSCT